MKILGVIPARLASTRFPQKPLALIAGKPMIAWVVEGAKKSKKLDQVIVATDDAKIFAIAEAAGAKAVMTDSDLPSGSDRIFQAVKDLECDLVVNIQGDEPLVSGEMIDTLVAPLIAKSNLQMATLGAELDAEELNSSNVVKIICNEQSEAIYFSRFAIPYSRLEMPTENSICLKHIGMYAYTKKFLEEFCLKGPVALETAESLEQLRALYMGAKIIVTKTNYVSMGVDIPSDVLKIESILAKQRS